MQRGVAYALASALLFGLSTPLAKALVDSISPLLLAGLLYAGSGCGLLLVLFGRTLWTGQSGSLGLPPRAEWLWLAGSMFFGGVLGPVALLYGLVATPASTASSTSILSGSICFNMEAAAEAGSSRRMAMRRGLRWLLFFVQRRVTWISPHLTHTGAGARAGRSR